MKAVFPSSENVFLTNSLYRLVRIEYFFIQGFVEAFEFRGWQLLVFWLVELIFSHFSNNPSSES